MGSALVSFQSLPIPPQDPQTTYNAVLQRSTEFEKKEAEKRRKKYHEWALSAHTGIQKFLSAKNDNQWPYQISFSCDFFTQMNKKEKTDLETWFMKSFLNYNITLTKGDYYETIQINISPKKSNCYFTNSDSGLGRLFFLDR